VYTHLKNKKMKNIIIIPILFLLFANSFAQDLNYEVHGKYTHPIKKETLDRAKSMSDMIPYYPSNWIAYYISVEILATNNGMPVTSAGINDQLSTEQKQILSSADPGTDVVINISFTYNNSVTDIANVGKMHYIATIVPQTEAEYPGGNQQMNQYFKENVISKIPGASSKQLPEILLGFTVNEEGKIDHARIIKTSRDPKIDELLLEAITNMPKWRPAEDSNGTKVKQEFEFSVGRAGC
jgi:TonB family protein